MKTSSVNQIEIIENGTIQARFAKDIVDGDEQVSRTWHRTSFQPGQDIDAHMVLVNAHLAQMGWPPITDYQAIKDHADIAWTPEVIAAYQAQLEDT